MVLPFNSVPIIELEPYGNLSAPPICHRMKIQSQDDHDKLLEAKNTIYTKSFNDETSLAACIYYEPEGKVISRSNDECFVAFIDQWFLDYGTDKWKQEVKQVCSYGLGTKLPWNEQYI